MDKLEGRARTSAYDCDSYDYDYWRWWHNVLGVVLILAITVLISWW